MFDIVKNSLVPAVIDIEDHAFLLVESQGKGDKTAWHFYLEMSLEKIHREILRLLYDNSSQDFSDTGDVSRKILVQSVNFKPRQIEKACSDLESKGYVHLHTGIDFLESKEEWDSNPWTPKWLGPQPYAFDLAWRPLHIQHNNQRHRLLLNQSQSFFSRIKVTWNILFFG